MRAEHMKTTPFTSSEPERRTHTLSTLPRRVQTRGRGKTMRGSTSMLLKIGLCSGVLAAVLLIRAFALPESGVLETVAVANPTDPGNGEMLGRLQFVEGAGVRSVFSGTQRWMLPVRDGRSESIENGTLLRVTSLAGETVSCPAAGEVREIGTHEAYGAYVRVYHGSGLESLYYNLSDVAVELGQPVSAYDTLGMTGEDGTLYVAVLQSGQAKQPDDYIEASPAD